MEISIGAVTRRDGEKSWKAELCNRARFAWILLLCLVLSLHEHQENSGHYDVFHHTGNNKTIQTP